MSAAHSYSVIAVNYADRQTTFTDAYYRWPSYGEPDGSLAMAYYFWLLFPTQEPAAPPIVIDTGFEPARGAATGRTCRVTPADALSLLGVDPTAVQQLIISHLHYDHIGNVGLFPNARISVDRCEYDFWVNNPVAHRDQFGEHTDWHGVQALVEAERDGRVDLIESGTELAPGILATRVGGHSPGQLIFDITVETGELCLAGDAVHYYDELDKRRPFGVFADLKLVYEAYGVIEQRADSGAILVPGHDPAVMDRFPPVPGPAAEIAVSLTD